MTRTTSTKVKEITASSTDDNIVVKFIEVASSLIDQVLANGCSVSNATILEQAETFLTAHLLTTSGGGEAGGGKVKTEEEFENYKVKFAIADVKGDGVTLTTYGQTANILMQGCLSSLNAERATIGFF